MKVLFGLHKDVVPFDPRTWNTEEIRKRVEAMARQKTLAVRPILERIVIKDYTDRLLREHVDKGGFALTPLAKSTLKNRRRGSGPPLAPHGAFSRFIKNLRIFWIGEGDFNLMVMQLVNVVDKRGDITKYHLNGTKHIPKRDVLGIGPKAYRAMGVVVKKLIDDVLEEAGNIWEETNKNILDQPMPNRAPTKAQIDRLNRQAEEEDQFFEETGIRMETG